MATRRYGKTCPVTLPWRLRAGTALTVFAISPAPMSAIY